MKVDTKYDMIYFISSNVLLGHLNDDTLGKGASKTDRVLSADRDPRTG